MKKIRFLAILLAILMLPVGALFACEDTELPEDTETDTTERLTRPPTPVTTHEIREGYIFYNDFNSYTKGELFKQTTHIAPAKKNGVAYVMVDGKGNDGLALQIKRTNTSSYTSELDGFINVMYSNKSVLAEPHVLEFDILSSEDMKVNFEVNARKEASGAKFQNFIKITPDWEILSAMGDVLYKVEDMGVWTTISIVVHDADRYYDVYVNGTKYASRIGYTNAAYPGSENDLDVYRLTIASSPAVDTAVTIDNLCTYRAVTPTIESPGEINNYKGSQAKVYEYITQSKLSLEFAYNKKNIDLVLGYVEASARIKEKVIGYELEGGEYRGTGASLNEFLALSVIDLAEDGTLEIRDLTTDYGVEMGYYNHREGDEPNLEMSEDAVVAFKISNFASGMGDINFKFPTKNEKGETIDYTNYKTVEITIYVPAETAALSSQAQYNVMLCVDTGTNQAEGGWSYYSYYFNLSKAGWQTITVDIESMGKSRGPDMSRFTQLGLKFSGWAHSGNASKGQLGANGDGAAHDGYTLYVSSMKLFQQVRIPFEEGSVACSHEDEDGESLFTKLSYSEPTCLTVGFYYLECTKCGATKQDPDRSTLITDKIPHVYDEKNITIELPDCTRSGSSVNTCTYCGLKIVLDTQSALGHDYVSSMVTMTKSIHQICTVCGVEINLPLSDALFTPAETEASIGTNLIAKYIVSAESRASFGNMLDSGTVTEGSLITNPKWSVFNRRQTGDGLYYLFLEKSELSKSKSSDPYTDLNSGGKHTEGQDYVLQLKLAAIKKDANGKYPAGAVTVIDRNKVKGTDTNFQVPLINVSEQGLLKPRNGSYSKQLIEGEFVDIAAAVHFSLNTYDLYINGYLVESDIPFMTEAEITARGKPGEFRVNEARLFQMGGGSAYGGYGVADLFAYHGSYPVCVLGSALGGLAVEEYYGDITPVVSGAEVGDNGEYTVSDSNVIVKTDASKYMSAYTFEFKLRTDSDLSGSTLLTGVKRDKNRIFIYENLLYVNEDNALCYGDVTLANLDGVDELDIAITADDQKGTLEFYINGVKVAGGPFAYSDYEYSLTSSFLHGFRFEAIAEKSYDISDFALYQGPLK